MKLELKGLSSQVRSFAVLLALTSFFMLTNASCKMNKIIKTGSQVKINYTLTVDGKVVDTSVGKTPLPYVAGSGQIIPGLDQELLGLKVGDKKKVIVPPEKGYGVVNAQATQKIPKTNFGDTKGLKVGMMVQGSQNGHPIQAKVVEIGKKDITLDFNHPLAGKTLTFDIEVMDVQSGSGLRPEVPPMPQPR